jgi:hypothetical protein
LCWIANVRGAPGSLLYFGGTATAAPIFIAD